MPAVLASRVVLFVQNAAHRRLSTAHRQQDGNGPERKLRAAVYSGDIRQPPPPRLRQFRRRGSTIGVGDQALVCRWSSRSPKCMSCQKPFTHPPCRIARVHPLGLTAPFATMIPCALFLPGASSIPCPTPTSQNSLWNFEKAPLLSELHLPNVPLRWQRFFSCKASCK